MNQLTQRIKRARDYWLETGTWVNPDLQTAVAFMVTEAAESLDAVIRLQGTSFWRTHPDVGSRKEALVRELAQTVLMAAIALEHLDTDLEDAVGATLRAMTDERRKHRDC